MAAEKPREGKKSSTVHERYRAVLGRPALADREIEEMRKHIVRLARTVCEHAWGKKFY